jgi:methionyl-tRNA formyltransferase
MTMSFYNRVILIGFGKIAQDCLRIIDSQFDGDIHVVEFEKSFFGNTWKNSENIIFHQLLKKTDVNNFFLSFSDSTFVVSANNNFLFPKILVEIDFFYIINFHNSLLPKHKGRNAQSWAIYEQDLETGITWHEVNAKVDAGGILCQKKITLFGNETALSLTRSLMELGVKGFEEIFLKIINKNILVLKQDINQNKINLSKETPNNGALDLNWSFNKIHAFLRSFNYGRINIFPKPTLTLLDKYMIINKYVLVNETNHTSDLLFKFYDNNKIEVTENQQKLILHLTD